MTEPPTPVSPPAACDAYRLAANSTSPSPTLSVANINLVLDLHNQARRNVQPYARVMPMLQWSQDLANFANDYAATCPTVPAKSATSRRLRNASFPQWEYIGENMAAGSGVTADDALAVFNAWMTGADGYSYPDCAEGRYCGAYLQIVWAATTHIGCAVQACPSSAYSHYWVCNYGVGGGSNVLPVQPPYEATSFVSDSALCTGDRYGTRTPLAPADDCEKSYFLSASSPTRSLTLSNNDINTILKGHNDERRAVFPYATQMPMLQWSQDLANFANDHAATCPGLKASDESRREEPKAFPQWWYVGESLAAGHNLSTRFAGDIAKAWAAGGQGYQYPTQCAAGVYCDPFRQMVWGETTHIGCAYSYCPTTAANAYPYLWVCNYGVGGGVNDEPPYSNTNATGGAKPPAACTDFTAAAITQQQQEAEAAYMASHPASTTTTTKAGTAATASTAATTKGGKTPAAGLPQETNPFTDPDIPIMSVAPAPPAMTAADAQRRAAAYRSTKARLFREMSAVRSGGGRGAILLAEGPMPAVASPPAAAGEGSSSSTAAVAKERSRSREESTRRRSRMAEARENARIERINRAILSQQAMGIPQRPRNQQSGGGSDGVADAEANAAAAANEAARENEEENMVEEH